MALKRGKTDVIFQGIKLYIEGVQVPFNQIQISQGIGNLPSANIVVPPQAGLMDIARFYQPKVHIFFDDTIADDTEEDETKRLKLLFSGIISSVSYSKVRSPGNDGANINISCVHHISPVKECLVDYSGWFRPTLNVQGEAVKMDQANSAASVIEALAGIVDKDQSSGKEITEKDAEGKAWVLPQFLNLYKDRFSGMTGVMVNYWQQIKRAAFNKNFSEGQKSDAFKKLYRPLIEDGIQFFQRMAGHTAIEKYVDLEENKVDPCPNKPGTEKPIKISPSIQLFFKGAIQSEMAIGVARNMMQNSGEVTNVYDLFASFFDSIDYDVITLASPAMAPNPEINGLDVSDTGEEYAVETIVKPRLPFYYAPTCNVLLPGMYYSVSITYEEAATPTRIDAKNVQIGMGESFGTHFRAPHSVREAIAAKTLAAGTSNQSNLLATLSSSFGAVGDYEVSRGIRPDYMSMPRWLSLFMASAPGGKGDFGAAKPDEKEKPIQANFYKDLEAGWKARYPDAKDQSMNPWSEESGLGNHQRMLIAAVEYYYTQAVARTRMGNVQCPFNPYIVPGYPIDILEANPNLPSFHAYCTQVTHSISAQGISTSVDFVAAMTYSELANYYIPFVSPFLQSILGLAKKQTILYNDDAWEIADEYYKYVLGVESAQPEDLYQFGGPERNDNDGRPKPLKRIDGKLVTGGSMTPRMDQRNYGELNPNLSYEGNLALVHRPIESMADIMETFGYKFIDMNFENYTPVVVKYTDQKLEDPEKFELGASQFLEYETGERKFIPQSEYGMNKVLSTSGTTQSQAEQAHAATLAGTENI